MMIIMMMMMPCGKQYYMKQRGNQYQRERILGAQPATHGSGANVRPQHFSTTYENPLSRV
eukprot:7746237-Karenia_brevis.AAC.1